MRVRILTFCDFLIDRLYEHRARRGVQDLVVPEWFSYEYSVVLNRLGASLAPANGFGKVLKFLGTGGVQLSVEFLKQCFKLFRSIIEVLYDYDSKLSQSVFEDSLVSGLKEIMSWPLDSFVKFAKYITVYPMAKFLRNPLPKCPDGYTGHPLLFPGSVRRYLRNRLVSHNKHCARLFLGYLQGVKRGAATVPDSFIEAAMEDHQVAMDTEPSREGLWSTEPIISAYADKIFRNIPKSTPKLFEASNSACLEQPRSEGGARGYLKSKYLPLTPLDNFGVAFDMGGRDEMIYMAELKPGEVRDIHADIIPVNLSDIRQGMLNRHPITRKFGFKVPDQLFSKVSAVLEPLKVRLITKGETWHYYFSRFYQKDLWSYLQTFPQFVLTGRPLLTSDLYDMVERERSIDLELGPDVFYVSGDYKAATDNLNIYYTKAVFEAALRRSGLSDEDKQDLRKVIYEQYIVYPSDSSDTNSVLQKNGQLMGSTLSFPILCVVNLIAYWWSLEEYTGTKIPVRKLPVLINGDDIGFRANDLLYSIWLDKIKLVGFSLSLGKNYCSKHYFTLNSKMFHCVELNGKPEFSPVGYLNVGLLQNTVVDRRTGALRPLWDNYNETLDGAVNKVFAHRRFFHYNHNSIRNLTRDGEFNLFISPLLGGLGFKVYSEIRPHIYANSFQRKLATFIINKLKSGLTTARPISDFFSAQISLSDSVIRSLSFKPETRYHLGTYKLLCGNGPLRENERLAEERTTATPFMMVLPTTEGPVTEISFPTAKLLKEFRKNSGWIHGKAVYRLNSLFSRPYRLIEQMRLHGSDSALGPKLSLPERRLANFMCEYTSEVENVSFSTPEAHTNRQ